MTRTDSPRSAVGLRSERGPVLGAVMLSTGLVAIDATILATAVPAVVRELGGFSAFPWLFSIYLLTQAVSVPVYGKLADHIGRKPVMLIGIGLFVLGSVLCGCAWSMGSLIAFRAVQGLGAGAVQPMGITILGDLYTVAERATVQGYVALVWGASSVVGPTLGGLFVEYASWRWIFFVNIPIGAAAAYVFLRRFPERAPGRGSAPVDYSGAALLTAGAALLLLGLLEGGEAWAWLSPAGIGVLAGSLVLLVLFVLVERQAASPVLPLWVFRRRVIATASAGSALVGVLLIGLSSYVPLYAQGVLGADALTAGFALAALTLGWPISASLSGRVYLRVGFRTTTLLGSTIALAGTTLLLLVRPGTPLVALAGACFVIGLGMGFAASPMLVAAQAAVDWGSRGVVTGASMFARSVGSAVGIAAFGAVANAVVAASLGSARVDLEQLDPPLLHQAVHAVFLFATVAVALLVIVAACMPGGLPSAERD